MALDVSAMAKRPVENESDSEMWIRPRSTLKEATQLPWGEQRLPSHSRYLELADIALGGKKQAIKKKKPRPAHDTAPKTNPYFSSKKAL